MRRPRPPVRCGRRRLELLVGDERFVQTLRESELRANFHDVVRDELGAEEYHRLGLSSKFPDVVRLKAQEPSIYIQDYLEQTVA